MKTSSNNNFKIGDNFLGRNGQRMVLTDVKTIGDQSLYELIHESGKKQTYSIADMRGLEQYTGKKKISAKTATKYADKWDELGTKMSEYYKKARENPAWSYEDKLKFFKNKIDPITKSLNGYKANISKIVGHTADFDPAKTYSLEDFNKERKKAQDKILEKQKTEVERQKNKYEQSTSNSNSSTVNRNLEAGDTVDINTGDIKKADGTIIKKDGTVIRPNTNTANATIDDFKRNTQKFFNDSGASTEDIVNNFDSYFSQAMKETDFSKIDGKALMDYRNELKKSYDDRWTQETERAAQEKIRQREIEIENKKKNAKASDTEYWNGQQKRSTMDLEDGIKAEFFYDENGEVLVQKLIHPDGKRDISVRRTAEDLERFTPDELDGAKHQISKKRLIRDGNIIEINETPDSMYTKTRTVDLGTGNVETKHRLRDRPWGGGKQEEKIINSKLKTSNVNNETPKINNNFRGNKNNRTPQERFMDKIIGKQNPGQQTSRVFNYGGKEYAIYNNLEVNSKDLSKGFTGGRVVDLETNKLINAREAFPEINQALMDGDLDTAFEKISSFEESKYTFSRSELDEKIVNKHTDNANTQNQNQQQTTIEQQNKTEQQHRKQEDDFEETRTEQKQQTKENHKENKKLNTENADTSKTKTTKTVDVDGPETGPIIKTKKQKLERMKGKKLSPGSTKVKSNLKVGKNVKGKDLRQILVNTTVSKALNTVEETVENAVETGTKTAMNHQRVNILHPDQMDDFQIGDLSDEEFEHIKQLANGKQEKIDEWTERRNKARANKVLEHYTDQASGNYYSNSEFKNPYEYKVPNMEFEVDADGKTVINKTGGNRTVQIEDNMSSRRMNSRISNKANTADDILSWMKEHKLGMLDIGMNVYGTISTYKESRREGRGVVSSAIRAGANFAVYEMLGFWGSLGVGLAKNLPSLAIKGTTLLYKENRKMNSAANNQLFGGAQFQDTQQLATMRQSGMEMAKMAQYNLQQTLMGNEATHFHR